MAVTINASTSAGLVQTADTSGVLQLQTNSGTTAVTIDTSQNVGIGTAIPNSRLHVSSGAVTVTGASSTTARINMFNNAATTGGLLLGQGYASGTDNTGYIFNVSNAPVVFGTNDTERMRIDSSGKVGIGMSPTDPLTIQCSSQTFGGGLGFKLSGGANNWGFVVGGDAKLYLGYSATTTPSAVGNFATNGTYTATSDIRKKKDISYTFNGLDIVNALKPAQGRMLEDNDTSPLRPMFIAQDMVDVIPALVSNLEPTPSDDPLLGVDYASIAPILVKAIQEQQTIINDLKARVTALEAK